MDCIKYVTQTDVDALRAQTDEKIAEILNAPNPTIPAGAITYYVSPNGNDANDGTSAEKPWKTVEKVNDTVLPPGSYVCFARGGVWRNTVLTAQTGVTYTAYGQGEKPRLYGSPEDGAAPDRWEEVARNIWYYRGSENMKDIGALVFNGGEAVSSKVTFYAERDTAEGPVRFYNLADFSFSDSSSKKPFNGYRSLSNDLQIYHDSSVRFFFSDIPQEYTYTGTGKLYLYSTSNPGLRFSSIEFLTGRSLVSVKVNNVTFDGLCFRYTGVHGIGAAGNVAPVCGLTVRNCEFQWIGGSVQYEHMGRNYSTRLGNAVEIYGACDGFTVRNNYFNQIYDTAMTVQANYYNVSTELREKLYMKNVSYLDNVIERCEMAFEIWMSDIPASNPSRMENYLVQGNAVWYTSYGFCEQRPFIDRGWSAAVKNRCSKTGNRAIRYVIRDNLFVYWKNRALQCTSNLFNPEGSDSLPYLSANRYVEVPGKKFGQVEIVSDNVDHVDGTFDESVAAYMTDHADPARGSYYSAHGDGTDQYLFIQNKV